MANVLIKSVKGMRDFYPGEWAFQKWLARKWLDIGALFGYQEYEGPIVEPMELYLEKSSEEIVTQQTFSMQDRDGNRLVLRPELTPTLARMVAQKENELPLPVRWQSFGPFFRYEKPQRGRGRGFFQWNVDCIGSESILADAEILTIAALSLKELGLTAGEAVIKVNDRAAMQEWITDKLKLSAEKVTPLFRAIDRMDKAPPEVFHNSLRELGLNQGQIGALLEFLESKEFSFSPWLAELFSLLKSNGVAEYCEPDLKIIRGFDYYTRTVFEAWAKTGLRRALFGGGRYDNLTLQVGGKKRLPGVGFAPGDMAVYELLAELGKLPALSPVHARALITVFSPELRDASLKLARDLRKAGVAVEIYPDISKLDRQIKYADQQKIPYAVIIGPEEAEKGVYILKDLAEREQKALDYPELCRILKGRSDIIIS
ncbi:MAG: histidine--tRNA ligase [Bacillota bacterium]